MNGSRRGRRKGWERERETGAGERMSDRDGRKIERETGAVERQRQGVGEREREEREKITNTKKFKEFYLVVLHSAERSEARQWIFMLQSGYRSGLGLMKRI